MKKVALLAALPLVLAACNNSDTPTSFDVSGTINGTQPSGTLKLALVGVSLGGVVDSSVAQLTVALPDNKKFTLDYPKNPADGLYQVIGYIDANNNGKYDVGEKRTAVNDKFLAYSKSGNGLASLAGLKAGWNYVVGTKVSQPGHITDYDLSW